MFSLLQNAGQPGQDQSTRRNVAEADEGMLYAASLAEIWAHQNRTPFLSGPAFGPRPETAAAPESFQQPSHWPRFLQRLRAASRITPATVHHVSAAPPASPVSSSGKPWRAQQGRYAAARVTSRRPVAEAHEHRGESADIEWGLLPGTDQGSDAADDAGPGGTGDYLLTDLDSQDHEASEHAAYNADIESGPIRVGAYGNEAASADAAVVPVELQGTTGSVKLMQSQGSQRAANHRSVSFMLPDSSEAEPDAADASLDPADESSSVHWWAKNAVWESRPGTQAGRTPNLETTESLDQPSVSPMLSNSNEAEQGLWAADAIPGLVDSPHGLASEPDAAGNVEHADAQAHVMGEKGMSDSSRHDRTKKLAWRDDRPSQVNDSMDRSSFDWLVSGSAAAEDPLLPHQGPGDKGSDDDSEKIYLLDAQDSLHQTSSMHFDMPIESEPHGSGAGQPTTLEQVIVQGTRPSILVRNPPVPALRKLPSLRPQWSLRTADGTLPGQLPQQLLEDASPPAPSRFWRQQHQPLLESGPSSHADTAGAQFALLSGLRCMRWMQAHLKGHARPS